MILTISSKDRNPSYSSNNFTIPLPIPMRAKYISLLEVVLPNSIYNVDSSNQILPINDGTTNINILINPGAYTITNLVSQLQNQLNSSSSGFTFTYSSTTLQLTISRTTNFSLRFGSVSNNISYVLGFTSTDTNLSTTFTGTNVIALNSPMSIYIRINDFIDGYTSSGLPYTFRQTVTMNNPGVIIDEKINLWPFTICLPMCQNIQHVQIVLYKANGSPLNLNGSEP